MSIQITNSLTPLQIEQIRSLDASFPLDDVDFFALYEDGDQLFSAAAFIYESDSCCECYGFTPHEYRRQGYFTELLDHVIDELEEETDFIFYTTGNNADTMAALDALEAELIMEEHMMEYDLSSFSMTEEFSRLSDSASSPLTAAEADIDGTPTLQYQTPIGSVSISLFSSYYYLYGFEIHESHRGQGHGKHFLLRVMKDLASRKPQPLRLQVSGDNVPALSLYKKTGFQITETLFGYLY